MMFPIRNAQKPAMITPEMIEAGARVLALINCNSMDEAEACWPNYKEDAESCLTAALALHKPGVPGETEKLIERLQERARGGYAWDELDEDTATALRSLVLEVERLQSQVDELLGSMKLDGRYLSDMSALRERIAQLEAALAAAKAKPPAMPEGLPEGPWHVRRVLPDGYTFSVWSGSSCIVTGVTEKIARAIAFLPDLYTELAKAIAMADELWIAREQIRGELDAARNKTIEECILTPVIVRGFGTASDDYLNGFHDGALAKTDSIRALATGETKPADV